MQKQQRALRNNKSAQNNVLCTRELYAHGSICTFVHKSKKSLVEPIIVHSSRATNNKLSAERSFFLSCVEAVGIFFVWAILFLIVPLLLGTILYAPPSNHSTTIYFQHAYFILLNGCGISGACLLVHGDLPRQHSFVTTFEVYWPCAGEFSAVNAIGPQLRDPKNSVLTRWRTVVLDS